MVLVYLVFFFLILRFSVTLFNFISRPILPRTKLVHTNLVSVLIPARNEANTLGMLLHSLQQQEYAELEILVLDDDSTDDTARVCAEFAGADKRIRLLKGLPLPKGWLGKNYACHQLAEQAQGDYFLFLDADDVVAPGFIAAAVHRMKLQKLDLLSVFANQITISFGERLVVPMMHYLLLNLLPLRLVKLSANPSFSAASGQCMLFDADNYRANAWHQQVKNKVVEDVEIMKALKQSGAQGETLLANGLLHCRMYRGFSESISGFSKNLLAGFGDSVFGLGIYLFLVFLGPMAMFFYVDSVLSVFAIGLMLLNRMMISLLAGQSVWRNVGLHPLQMASLFLLSAISVHKKYKKSGTWKGRSLA